MISVFCVVLNTLIQSRRSSVVYGALGVGNPGGPSSETWNGVSMIAPVKKFGRARLSTGLWKTNMVDLIP